jgi:hypothetical protein
MRFGLITLNAFFFGNNDQIAFFLPPSILAFLSTGKNAIGGYGNG